MAGEHLRAVPDRGREGRQGHAEPGQPESAARLTIEQLAAESGMSVRNIRAHQARGLLPPPEVRQRVGYYGDEHVARLRLISELQADGFNLKGIERLLEGESGTASAAMLRFRRALSEPFGDERPEILTAAELAERFGEPIPEQLERAVELGLLVPMGDSFEVPSPTLLKIAAEVLGMGVPMEAALDVVAVMQRSSGYTARAFAELFVDWVWKPFVEEGRPEERWPEVLGSIERLRPIASEALIAVFQQVMSEEVEQQFGKELARISGSKRK